MKPHIDLTGRQFGRYTVIGEAVRRKTNRYWTCRCDCGTVREVPQGTLLTGQAQSCGCKLKEWRQNFLKTRRPALKHGHTANLSVTPEYRAWQNMNRRCHDPGFSEYTRYGQRGITVALRWRRGTLNAFENFLPDVGYRPGKGYSLERKNNDGNYEPGNVIWATPQDQANNRSTNTLLTLGDRTQTLAQWAREKGMKHNAITSRLLRGWSVEKALTTPVRAWGVGRTLE